MPRVYLAEGYVVADKKKIAMFNDRNIPGLRYAAYSTLEGKWLGEFTSTDEMLRFFEKWVKNGELSAMELTVRRVMNMSYNDLQSVWRAIGMRMNHQCHEGCFRHWPNPCPMTWSDSELIDGITMIQWADLIYSEIGIREHNFVFELRSFPIKEVEICLL